MSKIGDFFKHFKEKYDEEQRRLIRMDKFLDKAEENNATIRDMTHEVKGLSGKMAEIEHIYHIYHDQLGGNGQGEKYYKDIKALEERKTLHPESND